jgi:hypothetical protein
MGVWAILPLWRKRGGDAVALTLVRKLPHARAVADLYLLVVALVITANVWPI